MRITITLEEVDAREIAGHLRGAASLYASATKYSLWDELRDAIRATQLEAQYSGAADYARPVAQTFCRRADMLALDLEAAIARQE